MSDLSVLNLLITMTSSGLCDKWFVVVNIYAASRQAGRKWLHAKQLLESEGVSFDFELTGGKAGNAEDLTGAACRKGYRRILAVGGDGTIHDVFNAIMSFCVSFGISVTEFTLGVIPMGSGNDWIKSLGIKNNLSAAISAISAGKTSKQDVVRLSVLDSDYSNKSSFISYMVNVGGVGIDANVCEIVNHKKKHGEGGKILYVKALLASIRKRKPTPIRVEVDGKIVFKGDFLSIAFGVGKYSGGGMRQTPVAVIDDGLVDMTIIPDIPLGRIACEIYKLFTGKFLTIPELISTQSKSIFVYPESTDAPLVEVDGEVVGRAPIKVEVLPGSLNVIVPENLHWINENPC